MDSTAQPPLSAWQLLRDSIVSFYQDGMDVKVIEGILNAINNSCHMKKHWFIPITKEIGFEDRESLTLREEEHTAFCTWILGRLFCMLGRDSLSDYHVACVNAQKKILEVCAENEFMVQFFFTEYVSCLKDLLVLQPSEPFLNNGSYLLKRFTPLPVKALETLNLTPKYILIRSQELVLHLQKCLVEVIDSMVLNIVLMHQDLVNKCWFVLCQLSQIAIIPLKIAALKVFSNIINAVGCRNRIALMELCHSLKIVCQSTLKHFSNSADPAMKLDLLNSLASLVNEIIHSGCCMGDPPRVKDLLKILHFVISQWDVNKIGDAESSLEIACTNVTVILGVLPQGCFNPYDWEFLMKRCETQKFAVKILAKCIFDDIVKHAKASEEYHRSLQSEQISSKNTNSDISLNISATTSLPLWKCLNDELFDEITSIQTNFPNTVSKQYFYEVCRIVGKVKTLITCAVMADMHYAKSSEAKILRVSVFFFPGKIKFIVSFLHFIIQQLLTFKINQTEVWFSDSIMKEIMSSIRHIMLLPELSSYQELDSNVALSIASLPWVENFSDTEFNVTPEFVQVSSLYPEVKSEEMKVVSLQAIANISSPEASAWKCALFLRIINAHENLSLKLILEAIQSLPVLLWHHNQQQDILCTILISILESKREVLLVEISKIFALIVCILSGDVASISSLGPNSLLYRNYVCLTCHKDFPGFIGGTRNNISVFKDVVNKFMTLLTSPIVAVRQNMAASIGSLVLHLPSIYMSETVNTLMKYAEDEDRKVRLIFSKMVKFLIFSRDWIEGKGIEAENLREEHIPLTQVDRVELSHSRPRLERVLQMLLTTLLSRLSQSNIDSSDTQETLLATIVDIGCVPLDCVLLPVLKIVLLCVSHPMFSNPSMGCIYMKRIAVAHNTNVENLYKRFQTDLCRILVSGMGMHFHTKPTRTSAMSNVVYSLGFESVSAWLRLSLQCVLPTLMVYVVKFMDNDFLLKMLEYLPHSAAALVKENFQFIYPHVFLNESDEIVEKCVKKMEELSGLSAQQLIISSIRTIHNELLLHYNCKKERVEEGICQLIEILEQNFSKPHQSPSPARRTDIAKHLKQRFLGVLVDFDSLLESSSAEENHKMKALQSLPEIIRLMGSKYITPVRFKVLSTLRTALRLTHCDFPHLSCGAWEAFIQSVDIHELGPLLGTIAASLLPLLDQFPEEISGMLEWLVEKHEHELSEHIPDLFFLPDTAAIHNVYKIVQNHVAKRRHVLSGSHKLSDYLKQPLRFITHDNVDMRRHGLENLLLLLKEKQNQFTQSLLEEEVVDDDIAKLLGLLIEGCRDTDEDIQRLCVENLGMLGALDPGHLPHKKTNIGIPQILSVSDDTFAVQALSTLAKAYQAARDTRYLDCFAVAIQDLLGSYQISSQPSSDRKNLWDLFPVKIQQVMIPLENSSYYMATLESNPVWPHPLFGTRYSSSLTNWAHTWACRIVEFIEDKKAKEMFTVCNPSLSRDINCVLFFLPFILLYAVISGAEDQHKMMLEEMTFIIHQRLRREEDSVQSDGCGKYKFWFDRSVPVRRDSDSDSATNVLCAKTVFSLLDFIEKWVGWWKKKIERTKTSPPSEEEIMKVQNVQKFFNQFSKLDLAHGNYDVNEYARSLMYLEDHLMENKELIKDEEHLSFLERIYAQLNEPDGIKGALAIQCSQPKLLEAVVYHEVAGQHQEALACFELLAKEHSNDALGVRIQQGIIKCFLSLDQPYAALQIAEGATTKRPECRSAFLEAQAECFWRLNNFENLEVVLKDPKIENSTAWGVSIGRCLLDIRHNNQLSLKEHLCASRRFLSKVLSTASLENSSYLQGYPHIIKLHMLQELEEASQVISLIQSPDTHVDSCLDTVTKLVKLWKDRLELVQAASSVQEPLLRLHRCLLQQASSVVKESYKPLRKLLDQEIGTSWLKSAEIARTGECYQQAYIYLLNAEKYKSKRHFIELAKLHWAKNEQDLALSTLRRGLDEHFPNSREYKTMPDDAFVEDRKICAEAKLLFASYNVESMNVDVDVGATYYKEAMEVYKLWETSHALLADYYDRLSACEETRETEYSHYQMWAIISYTKSLRCGCSSIYNSMSRMLTIWLDFGKKYHSALTSKDPVPPKEMAERRRMLEKINQYIAGNADVLPSYMFMIGFSQLVSRICHPVAEVYGVIKKIIAKLILSYPQQTMWMLLAVHRSSFTLRKLRCQGVLDDPTLKQSRNTLTLITDFLKLGELLSELCQKPVHKDLQKTNVSSITKNLPKLLANPNFSKIMVPLQRYRTLTLPQKEGSSLTNHLPFALQVPHIAGIQEEVTILTSLQRPRKITFKGSDGLMYDMMCKDKDDLRLDARVMEFNSIVNKYLQKDPASRSRGLNIRTYSVVPLNEDCGLIEWVPNLAAFRVIVNQIYKEMGRFTTSRDIRKYMLDKDARLQDKREVFLKRLVPLHPPVFQNWFRNNFTDSRSWFEARKSYVRTLAVMSIVGYILGLGDRHGENILFDTTCGDVVHVDFNCLFNKGERFDWPERVPFRLTHNMVSAMGPTGVEGTYRIACEITLQMLRDNKRTLMSVLQPFVYDPNVEEHQTLIRRMPSAKKTVQEEVTNHSAVENVNNIDLRLKGMLKLGHQKCVVSLSVEGQTNVLIQEATNIDNLCQMYIGWGAYI